MVPRVVGSSPTAPPKNKTKEFGVTLLEVVSQNKNGTLAGIAQLVERLFRNQKVAGSNPVSGSNNLSI